jgi:hypothetical protein
MQRSIRTLVVGTALIGGSLIAVGSASGQVKAKAGGYCELRNQKAGRTIYTGDCTIKQTVDGNAQTFEVKMPNAPQPFVFTSSNGRNWRYNGGSARLEQGSNDGTFYWGDFKLYMRQETEARVSGAGPGSDPGKSNVTIESGSGRCRLTNTSVNRELYNGSCSVNRTSSNYSPYIFEIKMGSAQSFKFAGNGNTWMQAAYSAQYENLGRRSGAFTWDTFRLEVRQ